MSGLIAKNIRDQLLADTTLTNLVGSRIYNGEPLEDTPIPLIVITRAQRDTGPTRTLNGNTTGKAVYTYTLDLYALTAQAVEELADAAKAALDGWRGNQVEQCTHQRDYRADDENGYRVTMEFEVWGDDAAIIATKLHSHTTSAPENPTTRSEPTTTAHTSHTISPA